jgi:hypothetical protein
VAKESFAMSDGDSIGYKRPPHATRFQKGKSGNPRGRPRNRRREVPYDHILGQIVTIREDGRERRVTAAEAFLLQLTKKGLEGDTAAARASLEIIEAARARRGGIEGVDTITRIIFSTFSIGCSLKTLGLAIKLNPLSKEKVSWKLQPWIVEAALARLGSRELSVEEQRTVLSATRTPAKVNWPSWWTIVE